MILRKPYAFFIKYFKLFHAVMAVLVAFLLYRSFTLYNFFRAYVTDYSSALNDFSPRSLLTMYSFIMILTVIILTVILLAVMIYKKKPKGLYIYSLIVYTLTIVLYGFVSPILRDISASILDIRLSSALRDFFMIAMAVQFVSLILFIVRATGFDIKQFDFGSDLQKLDIDEKDSEEIEVALEFDKNKVHRQVRYKLRQLKYVYGENKFLMNTIGIIILIILGFTIYFNIGIYTASYNQGDSFSASGVTLNIRDVYLTNENPLGEVISNNDVVVIRFDVKKNYGTNEVLNTGLMSLRAGDNSYGQNNNYAKELYDLGIPYTGQTLTDEFKSYILAFPISEEDSKEKLTLKFNDNVSYVKGELGAKDILVDLSPIALSNNKEVLEGKLGEEINFDDSILGSASLKINSYEINDKFKLDYKYCYNTDKCTDSSEYVTPTATGSYLKLLMKINCEFSIDKNINNSQITTLDSFLNTFATISYKIDENWVTKKFNTQSIKPKVSKTSDYFIEVPQEIRNASEIYLNFNIRGYNYKYILK